MFVDKLLKGLITSCLLFLSKIFINLNHQNDFCLVWLHLDSLPSCFNSCGWMMSQDLYYLQLFSYPAPFPWLKYIQLFSTAVLGENIQSNQIWGLDSKFHLLTEGTVSNLWLQTNCILFLQSSRFLVRDGRVGVGCFGWAYRQKVWLCQGEGRLHAHVRSKLLWGKR